MVVTAHLAPDLIQYIEPADVAAHDANNLHLLKRRSFELGWICENSRPLPANKQRVARAWRDDAPVCLPGLLTDAVARYADDIVHARKLMEQTLSGTPIADLLEAEPIANRLRHHFSLVASSMEEHDAQGIEKAYFSVEDAGEIVAEDLWCKASWLSFHDEDASLRFRFSFGMEGYEDVATDPLRQHWAGELCERIFPESAALTGNAVLSDILQDVLGDDPMFVERIVYFNAPNGGAQFHHDVERGHAGVAYAQLTGNTFWLALSKPKLMDEITAFLMQADANAWPDLRQLVADRDILSSYMDESDHETVEALIDRNPAFIRYMVEQGHAFLLHPGDVLLMPQRDLETCVWHTVFCLDDEPGEGLSFALRSSRRS